MSDQLQHRLKVMRQMFEFAHLNLPTDEFRAFCDEANTVVGNWSWQARKDAVQKRSRQLLDEAAANPGTTIGLADDPPDAVVWPTGVATQDAELTVGLAEGPAEPGPDEVTIMTSGGETIVVKKGDFPF